jgi:hypothetical protein
LRGETVEAIGVEAQPGVPAHDGAVEPAVIVVGFDGAPEPAYGDPLILTNTCSHRRLAPVTSAVHTIAPSPIVTHREPSSSKTHLRRHGPRQISRRQPLGGHANGLPARRRT